jgi:type IV pilus assembly protein PilX
MNANLAACSAPRRQRGAALVIGLILLLVLTILAVSGVMTSTLELRMVGNQQQQERAFQAAEIAVEEALANPLLNTSTPEIQAPTAVPGSPGDEYEYRLDFAGESPLGSGLTGYSLGAGFTAFHFNVDATGRASGEAQSRHVQGFYIVGPGGS